MAQKYVEVAVHWAGVILGDDLTVGLVRPVRLRERESERARGREEERDMGRDMGWGIERE